MGEGYSFILIEGDQTSRINEIIEAFDGHDIQDVGEAENFDYRNKIGYVKGGMCYFIIGVCKGWTIIEQIDPPVCCKESCIKVSSLINGKVVNIGYETHVMYFEVIVADKGHIETRLKINYCHLLINEGIQYPSYYPIPTREVGADGKRKYLYTQADVFGIAEKITGVDVYDLVTGNKTEKMEKIWIKVANKMLKTPGME